MVGVANVNGVLSKLEDAQISVMDRGKISKIQFCII
jgi:hypothetical protein